MDDNLDIFDPNKTDNLEKLNNPNLDIFDPNIKTEDLSTNLFNQYENREVDVDFTDQDYLTGKEDPTRQNIDEIRAQRQSGFSKTMSGVGRVGVKVLAEVAKMPGMIGGLVASPFMDEPAVETIFNNAWIRTIEDANQYVNDEALPVYIKESVKNGNIIDNLTSIDFWATEGADGVGYIASMFVPGAALKGLGAGKALMKGATKLAKFGTKADDVFTGAQKAQQALSRLKITENSADMFNATIANTFFEAGAEAGGAMRAFENDKDSYIENLLNSNARITEQQAEEMYNQEKANLGRNIFWSNVGILIGPNMVASKILYGAKKGKSGMNAFRDKSGKFSIEGVKDGFAKKTGDYVGEFGKGFAREGFWEEAMQSSVEHKFMNQANGKDTSLINSYLHTLSSVDGQKAIALGGLLGGPMNVYSKYKQDKATEKRRSEIAPHLEDMLELFTLNTDELFTVDEETGKREINSKYAEKYGQEIKKLQAVDAVFSAVQAYEEETGEKAPPNVLAIAKAAQNKLTSSFVMPFVMQGEQGIQILKEALEQEDAIINKVEKNNAVFGENQTKDNVIASIVAQAEAMQKDYDQSKEYLRYFNPIKTTSENQEALNAFYSQLNALEVTKKQEKRFLEQHKINVEAKLSEMEIEMLKDYQLNIDTSNRAYKKFNTTNLSKTNKAQVPDVGAMTNERFNKENLGYNTQDTFFEWFRKQDHGAVYDNKKKESESLSNAMLNVNETLNFLYNKKEVKKAFDIQLKNTKDKIQQIEEANKKVAEEEKKKKEESEEEIINQDNKLKKAAEKKKAARKKMKQRIEILNNNQLFEYFESLLKKAKEDTVQIQLTDDIIERLNSLKLGFDGMTTEHNIMLQTSREEGLDIEFIDGNILNEDDRSQYAFTIKKRELKEEKPTPVDNLKTTPKSNTVKDDNLESQKADIEKRRQEKIVHTDTDKKGRTYTYFETTTKKDGLTKTKFTFNRSDKDSTQRSTASVPTDVALGNKYTIPKETKNADGSMSDQIPEDTIVHSVSEIREVDGKVGATVMLQDKNDPTNRWKSHIVLEINAEYDALENNKPGVQQEFDFTTAEPDTTEDNINDSISDSVNNSKENSQDDNSMAHAKLLHKVGNFADEFFIAYSETPRDKTGEKVTFDLGEVGGNKLAMEAKVMMQNNFGNESLSEEDIEFLVRNLSIVATVENGGESHLPFNNDRIDVPPASKTLKRNIINKWLKNQPASTTIAFQKPGKIQQDTIDGIPANNLIFDKDGNANVMGMEKLDDITLMFANKKGDLVDSSGDTIAGFNAVTHPGHMFVPVKMANGRIIPLKVNQRRINNTEAEIIFKIIKALTNSSINLSYKDNLDKLKESVTFTEDEIKYIETEIKALGIKPNKASLKLILSNFIFEGNTDKNIFEADGTQLRIKDDLIDHSDLDTAKDGIIEWLTTEKNRQVNKKASNQRAYKKHVFNTIITTDAVIGKPLFQGSTAIYLDPTMGENPITPVASQKKVTKKEVKRTGKSTKSEIKTNELIENSSQEENDANELTESQYNGLFSDDVIEAITVKEANDKKEESKTLEDKTRPVVKVTNTAKKQMSATERRKAREKARAERLAKKNKDNDEQKPCEN